MLAIVRVIKALDRPWVAVVAGVIPVVDLLLIPNEIDSYSMVRSVLFGREAVWVCGSPALPIRVCKIDEEVLAWPRWTKGPEINAGSTCIGAEVAASSWSEGVWHLTRRDASVERKAFSTRGEEVADPEFVTAFLEIWKSGGFESIRRQFPYVESMLMSNQTRRSDVIWEGYIRDVLGYMLLVALVVASPSVPPALGRTLRHVFTNPPHCCQSCGHDMAGCPGPTCPECGGNML